jgi:hypothetical protein
VNRGVPVVLALCQTTVQTQSAVLVVGEDRALVKPLTWTADRVITYISKLDDKLGVDGLRRCSIALTFNFEDNTRHRSR